jgi:molecular chaperone GrpE
MDDRKESGLEQERTESEQEAPAEQEPVESEEETPSEVEELREQVEQLQAKNDELLDKYRRTLADFANYRKRQDRDREQQRVRILMDVLRGLLPILDDFERALMNVPDDIADSPWIDGIRLIHQKLRGLLREFDVEPIEETVGKPFDPNFHSALLQEESEYPAGTITEELEKGYLLSDRVLRPSLVKVSSGQASGDGTGDEGAS